MPCLATLKRINVNSLRAIIDGTKGVCAGYHLLFLRIIHQEGEGVSRNLFV